MSNVIENRRDKNYDGNKTRYKWMRESMKSAVFFIFTFRIRDEAARIAIISAIKSLHINTYRSLCNNFQIKFQSNFIIFKSNSVQSREMIASCT